MRSRDEGQSVGGINCVHAKASKRGDESEDSPASKLFWAILCLSVGDPYDVQSSPLEESPFLELHREFPFLVAEKPQSEFTRSSSYFLFKKSSFYFISAELEWKTLGASMRDEMRLGPGAGKKREDYIYFSWFIFDSRLARLL